MERKREGQERKARVSNLCSTTCQPRNDSPDGVMSRVHADESLGDFNGARGLLSLGYEGAEGVHRITVCGTESTRSAVFRLENGADGDEALSSSGSSRKGASCRAIERR